MKKRINPKDLRKLEDLVRRMEDAADRIERAPQIVTMPAVPYPNAPAPPWWGPYEVTCSYGPPSMQRDRGYTGTQ